MISRQRGNDDLLHLLDELIDARLTPARADELKARLDESESARQQYVAYLDLHCALVARPAFSQKQCASVEEKQTIHQLRLLKRRQQRARLWRCAQMVIAATVLVNLGAMAFYWMSIDELEIAPIVGQVEAANRAQTAGGRLAHAGLLLRAGQEFDLVSGVALLRFERGASVSLQGPATVRVEGLNRISALQGRLLADVPPPAVGFTVLAGGATAVDLGTRFGVAVSPDGSAEFHVLEGKVQVSSDRLPAELLVAEQATRYSVDATSREALGATDELFVPSLLFARGVTELAGDAVLHLDPTKSLRSDGSLPVGGMHFFSERSGFALPVDLPVIVIDHMDWSKGRAVLHSKVAPTRSVLRAGRRVDAFFLQAAGKSDFLLQVTFRRPVLGLIVEPERLEETDRLLGIAGLNYLPAECTTRLRGAFVVQTEWEEAGDSATLSDDRRTLTLKLTAGGKYIDQVRILVEPELDSMNASR